MASSIPSAAFVRVETIQCVAQCVPAIMAAVPQVLPTSLPASAVGGPGTTGTNAQSVLSPLAPLALQPAQLLAWESEQRVKQLVTTALQFMRHSQRTVLSTDDINMALKHKNAAPIYGFDNSSEFLPPAGEAAAADSSTLHFTQAADDLFVLSDSVVNFEDVIQQPLPKVPADPTFSLHWLAVDGVQPLVPQNPDPNDVAAGVPAAAAASGAATVTARITLGGSEKEVVSQGAVKHVLSKEQQLYYEYVTSAMRGSDATLKTAVFKSLREDDGLYQLLPYFTQFIAEELSHNLHNCDLLMALMRMATCLVSSKYLHIEPYLHQLVPSILTCIVGKQLCLEPSEDHWRLRDQAADLLHFLCTQHSHQYPQLQPRITKTLLQAWLDPHKSLTTHYGCIHTLAKFGHALVKTLIIPYVPAYFDVLSTAMSASNEVTRMEASYVYHALLTCVGDYIRTEMSLATNPLEMAAAVKAATGGAAGTTAGAAAATATASTAMDLGGVQVKREDGAESAAAAAAFSSKKRRRDPQSVTLPSASGLSATTGAVSALLPDTQSLQGIQLLMELFGESLQPYLTAALAASTRAAEEAAAAANPAGRTAAPAPSSNTIKISRKNQLSVANTFA